MANGIDRGSLQEYVKDLSSSLNAQLALARTSFKFSTATLDKKSRFATDKALGKLTAAIDCFGKELVEAWGLADADGNGNADALMPHATTAEEASLEPAVNGSVPAESTSAKEASPGLEEGKEARPDMERIHASPKLDEVKEVHGDNLALDDGLSSASRDEIRHHWASFVRRVLQVRPNASIWPLWSRAPTKSCFREEADELDSQASHMMFHVGSMVLRQGMTHCHFLDYLVVQPHAPHRLWWDMASMAVLVYDLWTLPLQVFEYDDVAVSKGLRLATSLFWTVDIPCSFFVGYERNGVVELRFNRVAWNYLRSWFLLDAAIVTVDWMLYAFGAPNGAASIGRLGKSLRFLRVVRVLRFLRVAAISEQFSDSVLSGTLSAAFNILKWLSCLMFICHFIACAWYWVGDLEGGGSWNSQPVLDGRTNLHMYLVSFHWVVAQFTPSGSPHHPRTVGEEFFSIGLIFLGLVIFSSFIGSVTSTITALRKEAMEAARQNAIFSQYCQANGLTWELMQKITTYARYHRRNKARILEKDVPFLKALPETLVIELRCQVAGPILCWHALFGQLHSHHRVSLMYICHRAASEDSLMNGDELSTFHDEAKKMVFVRNGTVEYMPGPPGHSKSSCVFLAMSWFGESCLWLRYRHVGRFIAKGDTDTVALDSGAFRMVVKSHGQARMTITPYAVSYAQRVDDERLNPDIFGSPEVAGQLAGTNKDNDMKQHDSLLVGLVQAPKF